MLMQSSMHCLVIQLASLWPPGRMPDVHMRYLTWFVKMHDLGDYAAVREESTEATLDIHELGQEVTLQRRYCCNNKQPDVEAVKADAAVLRSVRCHSVQQIVVAASANARLPRPRRPQS